MKMKNYQEFIKESRSEVEGLIDIYASVSDAVWKEHEDKIMQFSVDGTNYCNNEHRMTFEDDWNVNIRIEKSDIPAIEEYVDIMDTKELADDGSHLYESVNNSFDDILNMPLEQRKEIQAGLEEIADIKKNESFSVNEELDVPNLGETFRGLYKNAVSRLKRWVGKKAVAFLINQSQNELEKKIDVLKMLDPTDLSDIRSTEVIYLGGGIDKTSEEGAAGWRDSIEEYFGMDHVVQGDDMIALAKDGKLNKKNYPTPLIMNPMRNELVRTNDPRFSEIFRKWKAGELNKETDHDDWKYWANVINKEIHAPDLRIVNACDTNLVKLDPAAGAGTLGEMQVSALRGLNLFVWLDNGYQVQDISPWLIPTVTKLVRNDEELQLLLNGIKEMNGGNKPVVDKSYDSVIGESSKPNSSIKKFNDFK